MMNHYGIEDIAVGMEAGFHRTITEDMMTKFKELSGDENSMHMNSDYAKNKGFNDRVVYGMLTSSFFSTIVGMYLPGENGLLQSIECDYLKPVYIGDNLYIKATIESIHKSVGQISIKALIERGDADIVVRGRIKALII